MKVARKRTRKNSTGVKTKPSIKGATKIAAPAAIAIATDQKKSPKARIAAIKKVAPGISDSDKKLQTLLRVLRDTTQPTAVRLAALQALQAASFAVVQFESCRGEYLTALRSVATDPDPELRQRVLGLLAREKDGFVQDLLIKGLEDPQKALVPPEKALQLLSYDIHTNAYSVARDVVNNPPSPAAREEALRLLAADAASKPLFEKILRDKEETKEARQIAAGALQSIAPEEFQRYAKQIVLDTKDYDDIRATSLTAMTHFGDAEEIGHDKRTIDSVQSMKEAVSSSKLKRSVKQFLTKYQSSVVAK